MASSLASSASPSSPSPSPPAACSLSVLVVGDGNFSFSLGYRRKHPTHALVATSFDAREQLAAKYPEAPRICAQLLALGARVLHHVDATDLPRTLQEAAVVDASSSSPGSSSPRSLPASLPECFDRIIFNHPHCGEENVRRHQSLLSHFFVSARGIVRPTSGRIHLTLAHGQPERWEAVVRAQRAGLELVEEIVDVDADPAHAIAYERKRHQNGRSFHRVTLHGEKLEQASTLFIFRAVNDAVNSEQGEPKTTASLAVEPSRKRRPDGEPPALVSSPSASSASSSSPPPPTIVSAVAAEAPITSSTTPQMTAANLTIASGEVALKCEPCAKAFKTAQGLRTHVRMVHELQAAPPAIARATLACDHCDRTFKNDEARRQHRISKHGNDTLIRPDWYNQHTRPGADLDGGSAQEHKCKICWLSFASAAELNDHWSGLQPKPLTRRRCDVCNRSFEEERALRQHQNFCRLRKNRRHSNTADGDASSSNTSQEAQLPSELDDAETSELIDK